MRPVGEFVSRNPGECLLHRLRACADFHQCADTKGGAFGIHTWTVGVSDAVTCGAPMDGVLIIGNGDLFELIGELTTKLIVAIASEKCISGQCFGIGV